MQVLVVLEVVDIMMRHIRTCPGVRIDIPIKDVRLTRQPYGFTNYLTSTTASKCDNQNRTSLEGEIVTYTILVTRIHVVWIVSVAAIFIIQSSDVQELFADVRESTSLRYFYGTGISMGRLVRLDLVILGLRSRKKKRF